MLFRYLAAKKGIAGLAKSLSKCLRSDRIEALTALADEAVGLPPDQFASKLRQIGIQSKKKPNSILPLPIVCDEQGEPILSFEAVAERWRAHFAEQEDGVAITVQDMLKQTVRAHEVSLMQPEWNDLPTMQDLEAAFRRTAKRKAFLEDNVPGDLLAKIPAVMAKAFFPLIFKQTLMQHEALLYKGGRLVPMYKKGDPKECCNYRSLFVSSVIGKALHSIYRKELGTHFMKVRAPLQIGGIQGQSITQATHCLQLVHWHAISCHRSVGFLFVDIQNAFYRLIRRHMTETPTDQRGARELFSQLGLPEEAFEDFARQIEAPPALSEGQVSPFLQSLFAEFYRDTWYKINGADMWTWTRRGSRPGDSFADLCFGYALARILKAIEIELLRHFPFVAVEWNGRLAPHADDQSGYTAIGPVMPVWADDIALAFTHDCPLTMLEVAPQIASLVLHHLATAGLKPNMQRGKTELLLDLRGKGAVQARRCLSAKEYKFQLSTSLVEDDLVVTQYYKHLGVFLERGGSPARDVRAKMAIAHDTMTRYRSQLFANRALPLAKKVQLFQSLIMNAVIFGSPLWRSATTKQWRQIEHGFFRLYKRLCVNHFGKAAVEWSKERILTTLELPSAEEVLRLSRLRYLGQLVMSGQPHVGRSSRKKPNGGVWSKKTCSGYASSAQKTLCLPMRSMSGMSLSNFLFAILACGRAD